MKPICLANEDDSVLDVAARRLMRRSLPRAPTVASTVSPERLSGKARRSRPLLQLASKIDRGGGRSCAGYLRPDFGIGRRSCEQSGRLPLSGRLEHDARQVETPTTGGGAG